MKVMIKTNAGIKVAFRISANRSNRPLLLLPPGPSGSEFFESYFERYENLFLIAPDYPGRGDSDEIQDNSIMSIAKQLDNTIQQLDIKECDILAFSFGTAVAVQLCQENKGTSHT